MDDRYEAVGKFASAICQNILANLNERTENFRLGDGFETTTNSVFSALIARQSALALGMAESPLTWSGHIAPVILRSMVDLLITFRWIAINPRDRSIEYVNYGLGSEKLLTSHYQKQIEDGTDDDRIRKIAEANFAWIESQQFHIFVEVKLGSWAGTSIRKMCEETGDKDLYNFAYVPFSAAVHNMWNHVGKWNARTCDNPMHKQHSVGVIADAWPIVDFMFRACKYLELTLEAFDKFYEFRSDITPPTQEFNEHIEQLGASWNSVQSSSDEGAERV